MFPYRWRWNTVHKNLWDAVDNIRHGIKNIFRWMPVIWGDFDWDWEPLASIMEYKLRRMSRSTRLYGHHVGSERHARQQAVCAELLRRLREDDYWERAKLQYGQSRYAAKISIEQQRADQKLLGKLLGKYLSHWWE